MIIRSVTFFSNIGNKPVISEAILGDICVLATTIRNSLQKQGHQVQSIRMATNSFCDFLPIDQPLSALLIVKEMEKSVKKFGIDYLSLGPALPNKPGSYALIPVILQETESIFFTGVMADHTMGIDIEAIHACAETIVKLGTLEENGFGNLFFAALANVPGGIPFLPAAYQDRPGSGFALAVEAADLAIAAFNTATSLHEAKAFYINNIETTAETLEQLIAEVLVTGEFDQFQFYGFDLTPAPFITPEKSVGTALETLGGIQLGNHGSLGASAFLMDALDTAVFRRSGFNGLMLPVLEDAVLARSVAEGNLSIKDLMMWSSVCGTGLDTIPIPGDTTTDQVEAILLDIASLSSRLRKPLTARLMPIPGKKAGEMTAFHFPYFVNTRVMPVESAGFSGLFAGQEVFQISPRN